METTFYQYLNKYNQIISNNSDLSFDKEFCLYDTIDTVDTICTADTIYDLTDYKSRINNIIIFFKRYPGILELLPDDMLNSRKIKFILMCNYDNVFFDKDIFLNVWMDYFKWKLTYSELDQPER